MIFAIIICILNKWIHYSCAFTWAFIKFTFSYCLNVSSTRVACDVNHRLYHKCCVPQHGNFMTNRKPASARIFHWQLSCSGTPCSSVFSVYLIFILSVFKLFILRDCTFKYTIYFFLCVWIIILLSTQLFIMIEHNWLVFHNYLLRTLPDIRLLQFRCLVIILGFYRPVLGYYLPVGTTFRDSS